MEIFFLLEFFVCSENLFFTAVKIFLTKLKIFGKPYYVAILEYNSFYPFSKQSQSIPLIENLLMVFYHYENLHWFFFHKILFSHQVAVSLKIWSIFLWSRVKYSTSVKSPFLSRFQPDPNMWYPSNDWLDWRSSGSSLWAVIMLE